MEKEQKENLIKIIVSGVLLFLAYIVDRQFELNKYVVFLIYFIPYIVIGFETIKEVVANILSKDKENRFDIFDEDFLMVVSSIGAFLLGEFTEATFVLLLFNIGEMFEDYAVDKSSDNIKELMDIRPDYANVLSKDTLIKVSPESLNVGDIIYVNPGEKVPLDGEVLEIFNNEIGKLDTSSLTGESKYREINVGEEILSGMINVSLSNREILKFKEEGKEGIIPGTIKIKVMKVFKESTVSKILEMVQNESETKSKPENFISKFAKVYTPIVCLLALFVAIVPSIITSDFKTWVYRALTFLVISCPCALVISIPLCFFSSIGGASKSGILIKGSTYVESLSKAKIACFDKTGTLTVGNINTKDKLKDTTKEAIANLKKLGIRYTIMLTGDKKDIASLIAKEAGLTDYISELLPTDKVNEVKKIVNNKNKGDVVLYIGDGINDAPCLMAADVGISMGLKGTDAAIEASDVVLMDDDPKKICKAIKIARKTMRIAKENIVFTLFIKVGFLILSSLGYISMGLAVFSDVGVLILAVLNSMRALRTKNL